jgi:hypothetical protein
MWREDPSPNNTNLIANTATPQISSVSGDQFISSIIVADDLPNASTS